MVKKIKKGFTIAEMLVAATILVVVLVFAVKSTTKKIKEPDPITRGRYVCECGTNSNRPDDGVHARSYYIINGEKRNDSDPQDPNEPIKYNGTDTCIFHPTQGINLYTIKVWNDFASGFNSRENSREFAVTSFSKRSVNVKLGNNQDPDIAVKGAFYFNDRDVMTNIANSCIVSNINKQEDCSQPGFVWENNIVCISTLDNNKASCEGKGYKWKGDNDATCTEGVHVEIEW